MQVIERDGVKIKVIKNPKEARKLVEFLGKISKKRHGHIALDFETTALRPDDSNDAQVRITSLSYRPGEAYVIDHFDCGSFASFCDDLLEIGPFYIFHVNFEGRWFEHECSSVTALSRRLLDIGHMRRSVRGGGPLSLKTMAKFDLKEELDKTEQNSAWSNPFLTDDQYFYAGYDAEVTKRLGDLWAAEMEEKHWNGVYVINEAWRAVNECEDTGLHIDVPYHKTLIRMWEKRRAASEKSFRKFVPDDVVKNIRSKLQISNMLKSVMDDYAIHHWPKTEKTAQLQTDRNTLRLMSHAAPYPLSRVLTSLMVFNRADKYLSTYGETLITKQTLAEDGRIHSRLNMAQAITGRFSSSGPNQQNFPHAYSFRMSFHETDTAIILADYSGVEIRVLAELSGDKILLHDAIYDDVHARSAIAIYQIKDVEGFLALLKKKDPRAKEMRTKAKAFTFQLLYGAGAAALSIALRCSQEEAQEAINRWAQRYSKAYGYRQYMYEIMRNTGFLPTASGRTIFVRRQDRAMPVAANYPIQGSAGDVMYEAMRLTQLVLERDEIPARIMASVHDEMLLRADKAWAKEAAAALKEGMVSWWLSIFPGSNTDHLVDVAVGQRWSDKA